MASLVAAADNMAHTDTALAQRYDKARGEETELWRALAIVFGIATIVSLGLAIYTVVRNEQLAARATALNARLETLVERAHAQQSQVIAQIDENEAIARRNMQLGRAILERLQ